MKTIAELKTAILAANEAFNKAEKDLNQAKKDLREARGRFVWQPGCIGVAGHRLTYTDGEKHIWSEPGETERSIHTYGTSIQREVPDFSDPATLGCLEAQALKAVGEKSYIYYNLTFKEWRTVTKEGRTYAKGKTKPDALLNTLVLAAKEKEE